MAEFAEDTTPKVEEIDSDDEEVQTPAGDAKSTTAHKGDKKTRKAMQKMGMKPVPGITRVAMKNSSTIVFAINQPEVYKSTSSNPYIVVGEPKVEDSSGNASSAQQAAAAAQQYSKVQSAAPTAGAKPGAAEDTDETGVSDDDITIVMGQANCTRGQAVAALKNNDNDIVNAIMELTI
jgi:nascent polypeptide-associated complex subunit alpha